MRFLHELERVGRGYRIKAVRGCQVEVYNNHPHPMKPPQPKEGFAACSNCGRLTANKGGLCTKCLKRKAG